MLALVRYARSVDVGGDTRAVEAARCYRLSLSGTVNEYKERRRNGLCFIAQREQSTYANEVIEAVPSRRAITESRDGLWGRRAGAERSATSLVLTSRNHL